MKAAAKINRGSVSRRDFIRHREAKAVVPQTTRPRPLFFDWRSSQILEIYLFKANQLVFVIYYKDQLVPNREQSVELYETFLHHMICQNAQYILAVELLI